MRKLVGWPKTTTLSNLHEIYTVNQGPSFNSKLKKSISTGYSIFCSHKLLSVFLP